MEEKYNMKAPKEFVKNLNSGIITEPMLEMVLYSINKRAKNCRDQKNKYYQIGKESSYRNDYAFKTVEKYKEKENEYYSQKDLILKNILEPICIHMEIVCNSHRVRYYDYEEEFESLKNQAVNFGGYYDRDEEQYVEFIDVIEEHTDERYYLFYETENYSFHLPIYNSNNYNLDVVKIDNLVTKGKDIVDLISVQFCNKVIQMIMDNDYKYAA